MLSFRFCSFSFLNPKRSVELVSNGRVSTDYRSQRYVSLRQVYAYVDQCSVSALRLGKYFEAYSARGMSKISKPRAINTPILHSMKYERRWPTIEARDLQTHSKAK